jgi:thiosulfate dehydrogenase [quinone] large subunit
MKILPDVRQTDSTYSTLQLILLVTLRLFIGWHFLYEGLVKVMNSGWSSAGYLNSSQGFLSDFYAWIVLNPSVLQMVDIMNILGLIGIGLGLILGLFTNISLIIGAVMLLLYYFVTPPFIGLQYNVPFEGSYLIINKTLIEFIAMLVLIYFPTGKIIGLDRLIFNKVKT